MSAIFPATRTERSAHPSLTFSNILFSSLAALVIGSIPILTMYTEAWQLIFGGLLASLTVIIALFNLANVSSRQLLQNAMLYSFLLVPVLMSVFINSSNPASVLNIASLILFVILGPCLLPNSFPAGANGYSWNFFFLCVGLVLGVGVVYILAEAAISDWADIVENRRDALDFVSINLHPNLLGLLCVTIAVGSSGFRSELLRGAVTIFSLVPAWAASSRDAMLGISVAYVCPFICRHAQGKWEGWRRQRKNTLLLLGGALVLAFLFRGPITSFLSQDVLLLDDPDRGADSGFSERTEIWQAALALWEEEPLFGVGYKNGPEAMGMEVYAHNMVLVLLSETGLFGLAGFTAFCVLVGRNGLALLRGGDGQRATLILTSLAVYWIYGLFEGLAINVGNPLSVCFFLVCFASTGGERLGSLTRGLAVRPAS